MKRTAAYTQHISERMGVITRYIYRYTSLLSSSSNSSVCSRHLVALLITQTKITRDRETFRIPNLTSRRTIRMPDE